MKVWKSPVFYFGVLLVVAVFGLLLAPFVVDWNGYRADLEAYGKKLTGREVTIEGPISARLFPWPRLTADKIAIANPPVLGTEKFATAERITIRMTLGGLLQGGIDVESIEVEQPTVTFERLETGEGNWQFTPSEDLRRSEILSRVRLDQISLTGGTLAFRDRRRGETVMLSEVKADVSSPGIAGPWRLRAHTTYNDRPIDIALNTGAHQQGEPFRFGLTVAASDGSGFTYAFDGGILNGITEGEVRVAPAAADSGKSDAEGSLRPLAFTAKVKGDFESIAFDEIQVSRTEPDQSGAIATGSATLRLGSEIAATADLKAAMLDVDALAGAQSRNILREAGGLAVLGNLLGMLPADMSLAARLDVTALKTGGQTLDNVGVAIEVERGELRIGRLAAGLPGRSDVLFKGVFLPGASGGELSGELALETSDLREMTLWLWPETRETLAPMWSGNRGRLRMQTEISLTEARLRLANTDFELDGERGRGALSVTSAGGGAVDLSLESDRFDFDAYAPQGIPALSVAARQGAGSFLAFVLPEADAPDLKLQVKAKALALNAVTARDVTIDLQSGPSGLDLRALDIGSVGGARVAASGLILDTGKGADGSLGITVEAGDPSELIRLLGLAGSEGLPPWAVGLGETELRASLAVKPKGEGSELFFRASGNAGDLSVAGQGTVSPGLALSGKLAVTAPNSGRIVSLFGLSPRGGDTEPGALSIDVDGNVAEGFTTTAALQAHGARLDYRGNVQPAAEGYGLAGDVTLKAADAAGLAAASGLPTATPVAGAFSAAARLAWADGKWTLSDVNGAFDGQRFKGSASLTPALGLEARIETGPLRLADVMAATFLDWSGPSPTLEAGFAEAMPFGFTGELWLAPATLQVHPQFEIKGAEIGIAAAPGDVRLSAFGKDADGRKVQVELTSAAADGSRTVSGLLTLPIDLGKQLALAGGGVIAEGEGSLDLRFESAGRSPAAALAATQGSGRYVIDDLRLPGISPEAFASALAEAKDASGVTGAFDALRAGEALDFGNVSGAITISDGQVNLAPLSRGSESADVQLKTVAELAAGQIDIDLGLRFKMRPDLPVMSIAYAGAPTELARSEDNTELATALGVTIMQQGIDELERLQQEQARLAELEEQQRIEDEARLQAYYAQRDELLLRRRELKVHGEMQVREADRLRRQIEAERAANAEINKAEIRQRQREIRVWRRLARLAETPVKPAEPVQEEIASEAEVKPAETAPVEAAPKPKPAKPAAAAQPRPKQKKPQPQTIQPVILAKPPGAPVVISPPPAASPSQ